MQLLRRLAVTLYLSLYLVFVLFPIAWLAIGSLKTRSDALAYPPKLIFRPTVEAYEKLFATGVMAVFGNSLQIALTTVTVTLLLGVPAAYGLSRTRSRARQRISSWLLSLRMVPAFGVALPIYTLMRSLGLLDTITAVIIAHLTINLPFAIWLLLGYFDELPEEIEEAAMLDGASPLQVLMLMVLPLSKPMLVAVSILVFLFSWNEFLFAFMLTSSEAQTVPALIASLAGTMNFDWPLMSAISLFALMPAFLFVFFAQRSITQGLTMGAVK